MRVELTVHSRDGTSRDVAVLARAGGCLADVRGADPALFDGAVWSGSRQLSDDTPLGSPGLCTGSVLTVGGPGPGRAVPNCVLRLHVVSGPSAGRSHPLTGGVVTIGRAPDNDVVLSDPDVSRQHAILEVTAQEVRVHDAASTNGVRVDGTPVGTGGAPVQPGALLRLGDSLLTVVLVSDPPAALRPGPDGTRLVNRPPRLPPRPLVREIVIPERRDGSGPQPVQWLAALLPAVAGVVLAAAMHSPHLLAFALLSPVLVLATALGDRVHWRRDRRRSATTYRRRAAAAQHEISAGLAAEARLRRDRHPDPAAVHTIASRPGARLWERGLGSDDAGTVRLGLARLPSALVARRGGAVEPAGTVPDVPLTVDLWAGPLGICAPPAIGAGLARWVVGQLAALHPPSEVEIALLLSEAAAPGWAWARWLPHVREKVAVTAAEGRQLVADLAAVVRHADAPDRGSQPWLVLVVDRAGTLATVPGLAAVLAAPPQARVTAVCVDTRTELLPAACATVAATSGETGTRVRVYPGFGGAPAVAVADLVDAGWADSLARALAPLAEAGADASAALPDSCRLLDVLGLDSSDPAAVLDRWARSDGAGTVLGLGAQGPVHVDLVRDGPHALIAGTTGAGKSELLQTLIAGLAATHPPDELSFVLVDYKGGAAFGACAGLPHVTGVVTDLDPHLTARALRSLGAEVHRREVLFEQHRASDLDAYRAGEPAEPLARLVLVVDEFAALAEELPDFVAGLVGLAQRGRSLGIHLVLATQRPGGVVSPEIRANTSLRFALRVTDPAESVDVVGSAAAARLDRRRPGRGYLRAGPVLTQVQVAHVGAPARPRARPDAVRIESLGAWRRAGGTSCADGARTDLHHLVECIDAAATRSARSRPRAPWLPALPASLEVETLGHDAEATSVRFGLVDLPAEQRQPPLALDLAVGTSLLVAGGARSGRSTALLTIALSAADRLGPDALHIHAIDLGGALHALAELPHCGSVVGSDSPELATILVSRLEREAAERRAALAGLGVTSVAEARAAGSRLPYLLVLVDGWESFVAASDEHDLGRGTETLLELLRTSAAAGVTVVVTGDRGALAPRLAGLVSNRLVLRLADRGDLALAGIPASAVPDAMPPGRAVRAGDAAEIQLAHPGRAPSPAESRRAAAEVARRWRRASRRGEPGDERVRPIRVRRLPARVELRDLPAQPGRIVLGLAGDDAVPVAVDPFSGAARLLIAGPARSGRTSVLRSALKQMHPDGMRVVVAVPPRSSLGVDARRLGVRVLGPDEVVTDPDSVLPRAGRTLLLVDDAEEFLDTAVGEALTTLARGRPDLALVLAGRTDDLLLTFRGPAAEVRRARCCLLLQPGPGDGELVGLRLPNRRAPTPAGRGLVIPDPAWEGFDGAPTPIQVAVP